jgi:hypothetical protein
MNEPRSSTDWLGNCDKEQVTVTWYTEDICIVSSDMELSLWQRDRWWSILGELTWILSRIV